MAAEASVSAHRALKGRCVLIVEDEYLLESDLSRAFAAGGAEVLGPFGTADRALASAERDAIDMAILDVNLRGDAVFPVADALVARDVPFVFLTGYASEHLPERFAAAPRYAKPMKPPEIVSAIASALDAR